MQLEVFEKHLAWQGPFAIQSGLLTVPAPVVEGIYRVCVVEEKYQKNIHGATQIVYYGSSKNLTSRLAYFFSAAKGIKNSHSGGKMFYATHKVHGLDLEDLEYWYCGIQPPMNYERVEKELLRKYKKVHSVYPFLNRRS